MQKIIIDNFRQISHAEIEVRDFLFLIGEQASGKSTIAKLIYFFQLLKEEYMDIINTEESDRRMGDDVMENIISFIEDQFRVFFGEADIQRQRQFWIQYLISTDDGAYIALQNVDGKLGVSYNDAFEARLREGDRRYGESLKDIYKEGKPNPLNVLTKGMVQLMPDIYAHERAQGILKSIADDIFGGRKKCLFIPAGRNITVAYPEQFQMLFFGELYSSSKSMTLNNSVDMLMMRDFISHAARMRDYFKSVPLLPKDDNAFNVLVSQKLLSILHGQYRNEDGVERISHNGEGYTLLEKASSGQQEAIRLVQDAMYVLNEGHPVTRIIEEPESHLFPTAQKDLIQLLIMVANKTGSQLIITTHSPHVMATFNNLLYYTRALQKEPGKRAEIEKHFGTEGFDEGKQERLNILVDKFQAYALSPTGETYCHSIFDSNTHLIGENYIDEATEEIYDDADFLYSLLY